MSSNNKAFLAKQIELRRIEWKIRAIVSDCTKRTLTFNGFAYSFLQCMEIQSCMNIL